MSEEKVSIPRAKVMDISLQPKPKFLDIKGDSAEAMVIPRQIVVEILELLGEAKLVLKGQHLETSNHPSSR